MQLGLEQLLNLKSEQLKIKGQIGLLCHSASFTRNLQSSPQVLQTIFGARLKKLFGPQHGFVGDVQDNMVETQHSFHPFFKLPIVSLYGEYREPTEQDLQDLDTIVIDLQDVGHRVYTYIYTMGLMMKKCAQWGKKVVILDRPNPIGMLAPEGPVLDLAFQSFVGLYPLPSIHGLTIGEMASYINQFLQNPCELEIIQMKDYHRQQFYWGDQQQWINPSPNLSTYYSTLTFGATVGLEGTNISEGRGTTRALEVFGHPKLEAYQTAKFFNDKAKEHLLEGIVFRPHVFLPMFQKWSGQQCGGAHLHVIDVHKYRPWETGQFILYYLKQILGADLNWKSPPYEYEYKLNPIDLIAGNDRTRQWVDQQSGYEEMESFRQLGLQDFLNKREQILLYK